MKLIGKWHCYLVLSPRPICRENILALKHGTAHLRKNPKRRKHETGTTKDDPGNAENRAADPQQGVHPELPGVGPSEGDQPA